MFTRLHYDLTHTCGLKICLSKLIPIMHLSMRQAMLSPVYLLYSILGPARSEWVAHGRDGAGGLAEMGGAGVGWLGYAAVLGALAAVPAVLTVTTANAASSRRRKL